MNYKKIIRNRHLRLKILGLADIIPDKTMIKLQYKIAMGRKLDPRNPKRFTEKLQWYKLNYRNPLMTKCSDKFEVREFLTSNGYGDILIPLYGVYDNADQIDFGELPNEFVLKTTNGSQTNIFCNNKNLIDEKKIKKVLEEWLTKRSNKLGREWPYYNIKPRIICEKFLEKDKNNDLVDYKFVTFNGQVEYVFVNSERESENEMKFGIYNKEFEHLPFMRKGLRNTDETIKKPINYDRMIKIAETLSKQFPHVRVDLYNIEGKIYFGEMTFFHGSGYVGFEPDTFDFILGENFNLSSFKKEKGL